MFLIQLFHVKSNVFSKFLGQPQSRRQLPCSEMLPLQVEMEDTSNEAAAGKTEDDQAEEETEEEVGLVG